MLLVVVLVVVVLAVVLFVMDAKRQQLGALSQYGYDENMLSFQ